MTPHPVWVRAGTALRLLAIDPGGLGGLWLRARPSPVRDRLAEALAVLPAPLRRLHPAVSDSQLYGGVDLAATLAAGTLVRQPGLLATPSTLILPMAERAGGGLAARLAQALDGRAGHCLVCLDEGADTDEALAPALGDRLAFAIDLTDLPQGAAPPLDLDGAALAAARLRLAAVAVPPGLATEIVAVAARFGIASLRAPLLALRAARAHAALAGRAAVGPDDLAAAAELVLAHRATVVPEPAPEPQPPAEAHGADPPGEGRDEAERPPSDLVCEAVAAALPPHLLGQLTGAKVRGGAGSGQGTARKGNRRGRPLAPREGRPGGAARIDLVATLRAAAPWQAIRRSAGPARAGLQIRLADLRLKRFEDRSDRLLIFVVDASGSAALARLAEAKGAVELLLAEAYARRDHVALVAFRGTAAELLLPPTRSLVQTKRRLAGLPGGGATPLAAGLKAALDVADTARKRGMTPAAVLLTDGRANIALDGRADRRAAAEDAATLAGVVAARNLASLVIDTGTRPERALETLAARMRAPYVPLPRADARALSSVVSAALEA